jgi:hypothetical protein
MFNMNVTPAYKRLTDEELVARINECLEKFPNISRSKLLDNINSSYDRIVGLEQAGKVILPQKRRANNKWSQNFQIMGKELGTKYGRRNRQSQ